MLALQQADEVRISIRDYLRATFGFRDPLAMQSFEQLLDDQESGLFKGPYVNVRLPYRYAPPENPIPLEIAPNFLPYLHQARAFDRLTTRNGHAPEPTIITTGTASGKTEAFLFPVLDYCYRNRERDGIKAIILYPMNALATDQAGRIAKAIHKDQRLKGVTAGLFIGEGRDSSDRARTREMGPDRIIEDRNQILASPPDILLTNFKMLDFSLLQSGFHNLWLNNLADPEVLRFLVIDELHTYDGVKGTDVANLIRRIKLKLNIPEGHICPVGTSATLGSGAEAKADLANFASRVFGEVVREEAVISEERQSVKDFFFATDTPVLIPDAKSLEKNRLKKQQTYTDYIRKQKELWGLDPDLNPVQLGRELRENDVVMALLTCLEDEVLHLDDLVLHLSRKHAGVAKLSDPATSNETNPKKELVRSLLALIIEARSVPEGVDKTVSDDLNPFLYVQTKLWLRELSPVVRMLAAEPEFMLRDQADTRPGRVGYLPAWFCRECGGSGWLSCLHKDHTRVSSDYRDITDKYFRNHRDICFLIPDKPVYKPADDYVHSLKEKRWLNPEDSTLHEQEAENLIQVLVIQKHRKKSNEAEQTDPVCPQCNTRNTLNIIGTRSSTLLSVAVSQVLSSDLDQRVEHDRKLLGFSESVQDAAHRAGFIQARNYRFTFRSALQSVINAQNDPISLSRLTDAFRSYWKEHADSRGQNHELAYLYRFFPEDRERDVDLDNIVKKGDREIEKWISHLDDRIGWEIASEFGYNAIIGRTLEKSGSSTAWIPAAKLEQSFDLLQPWLEDNGLEFIEKQDFVRFLSVCLYRIRTRGGVHHPIMEKYRGGKPNYYVLGHANQEFPLARRFGKNTRLPRLLTTIENRYEIYDRTHRPRKNPPNWYHQHFVKCFALSAVNYSVINEFYQQLGVILADEAIGLFSARSALGIVNYCIDPDQLIITRNVGGLRCDSCGHQFFSAEEDQSAVAGARCHQFHCTGTYQSFTPVEQDSYYREVYNRTLNPRIFTHEHTGLLDRNDREEIENQFKRRDKFNDPNVLIATSTLEMGIDIGDLDVSVNVDVPPNTASYKQRIGRAGRKSGSALIFNLAGRDDHALYYFEDPALMMEGEIHTPSCFLEAHEILKRHFYAFCFDSWSSEDPSAHTIPPKMQQVGIKDLDTSDRRFFINNFFSFVDGQRDELFDRFRDRYHDLDSDPFENLDRYVRSSRFEQFVYDAFRGQKEQVNRLYEREEEIRDYIREKGLDEKDPEFLDLHRATKDLRSARRRIFNTNTLEFMTNEGILPNYGFPETGIKLSASIYHPEKEDSETFEAVRPAAGGLRELAPDHYFYMKKYRLPVTGLEIANRDQDAVTWRFCSKCDALMVDAKNESKTCPKCGHASWGSAGNTHLMLNFTGAKSSETRSRAWSDDRNDQREFQSPLITRHFDFSESGKRGSYVMKNIPFGIEYDTNVRFRELNTGPTNPFLEGAHSKLINEQQVPDSGYVCCKICGRATADHSKYDSYSERWDVKKAEDYHYPYCSAKEIAWREDIPDNVFDQLYLKRELHTEAIKILLPVQDVDVELRVELFKAGLQIGLKEFFKGEPSHLKLQSCQEVNRTTGKKDQYLVIYDNIPGGSGYLSRLFDEKTFSSLLTSALRQLETCACQKSGKTGCYKCVYNYSNRYQRGALSREMAEEFYREICESIAEWQYQEGGLSDVTNTGGVEESELETRFIRMLRTLSDQPDPIEGIGTVNLEIKKEGGKRFYELEISTANRRVLYEIMPQFELGRQQGVQYATRPDFLLTPIAVYINDEQNRAALDDCKPLALYLDGYQYHASEQHNIFYQDVLKRDAILASGFAYVWTLTWNDLDRFESKTPGKDLFAQLFQDQIGKKVYKAFSKHPRIQESENSVAEKKNSVDRLLYLLGQGMNKDSMSLLIRGSLLRLQSKPGAYRVTEQGLAHYNYGISDNNEATVAEENSEAWMILDRIPVASQAKWRAGISVKDLNVRCYHHIKDGEISFDLEEWEQFWQLYSLLQFSDRQGEYLKKGEAMLDLEQQADGTMPISGARPGVDTITDEKEDDHLEVILENFDDSLHDVVRELIARGERINKDGYFYLEDDTNSLLAEAGLGLEERKLVVDPLDETSAHEFEKAGYRIVTPDEILKELER